MKNRLFVLLLLPLTLFGKIHRDSLVSRAFIFYGGSGFTGATGNMYAEFYCPSTKIGIGTGYELEYPLTRNLNLHIGAGISYYRSNYSFTDSILRYAKGYKGNIDYWNLYLTPELSFKISRRFRFNLGLSANGLLYNKFYNHEVGQKVAWNNDRNKSRMQPLYPFYSLGIYCKISDKLSLKLSYQKSFFSVIKTTIPYDPSYPVPVFSHKQKNEFITLYYGLSRTRN